MPYIKINADNSVTLAGMVATEQMLSDGYFMYDKEIPRADRYFWNSETEELIPDITPTREKKLKEIKDAFQQEQQSGHITSSLGFEINADDIALRNITSLIDILNDEDIVQFRDYNNEFHTLTKADLITLKQEIIQYGLRLYQKKWTLEQQIEQAQTKEELEGIKW